MADLDKIEKIKKVKGAAEAKPIQDIAAQEEIQRVGPNKEKFDLLVQNEKALAVDTDQKAGSIKRNSPIEEFNSSSQAPVKVTPTELVSQTQATVSKFDQPKAALEKPNAQIPTSVEPLLQNKLTNINDSIKIALEKAGLEVKKEDLVKKQAVPGAVTQNPVMRFLGMLTDGQYQMSRLALEVEKMHLNKKEINPAALLSIQLKVNYVTQELEFFTSLLNKALESTKTIMNVQV